MVSSVPEFALVRGDEGLVVGQRVDVDRLAVDVDQRDAGRPRRRPTSPGWREVSTGLTMIASTPEATKFLIWSSCLATSFCASSTCRFDAVQGLGVLDHAVAQHGQEVVVEQRHRHADLLAPRPLPAIETTTAVEARRFLMISSAERPAGRICPFSVRGGAGRRSPKAQGRHTCPLVVPSRATPRSAWPARWMPATQPEVNSAAAGTCHHS